MLRVSPSIRTHLLLEPDARDTYARGISRRGRPARGARCSRQRILHDVESDLTRTLNTFDGPSTASAETISAKCTGARVARNAPGSPAAIPGKNAVLPRSNYCERRTRRHNNNCTIVEKTYGDWGGGGVVRRKRSGRRKRALPANISRRSPRVRLPQIRRCPRKHGPLRAPRR